MNNGKVKKIIDLTKWALLSYLAVLTLTTGLEPGVAYAGENGKECAELVFDLGLPEPEREIVISSEFDKEKLYKSAVESFDSDSELFSVYGFEVAEFGDDESESGNTYASGEDLGGLDREVSDYESDSLKAGDILRAVPSITTKDEKTLGILMPPFAYFSKKF